MRLIRRIRNRYLTTIVPVAILGIAALCSALTLTPSGDSHPYKPSSDIIDLYSAVDQSPFYVSQDGVNGAFNGEVQTAFSILDYPIEINPLAQPEPIRQNPSVVDPQMFRDELSTYQIELKSDESELVNIELASKAVNNRIIYPYQVFSFNDSVGERSEERGFRAGLMFSNGEVLLGTGGGVCLVSTALFNTAATAGFKIIERSRHSGPVRYAEPGLDSAVVYGTMDLKFKNDSVSPILIKSRVENGVLYVGLYGKKRPGFEVDITRCGYKEIPYTINEVEDPTIPEGTVQVESPARMGYEVTLVRVFKQDGKVTRTEILTHDTMPARNKVVLIPPKAQEAVPAEAQPKSSLVPFINQPNDTAIKNQSIDVKPDNSIPNDSIAKPQNSAPSSQPSAEEPVELKINVRD